MNDTGGLSISSGHGEILEWLTLLGRGETLSAMVEFSLISLDHNQAHGVAIGEAL